ncbi:sulfite exporter TauE/SafE family protein [Lacrimispora sp.]|uniref:sulfite exporter TauE/SafE family protein n=1 Tax=Lacrimispora sp. TaxID=2719234 RepID=UPI003460F1A1
MNYIAFYMVILLSNIIQGITGFAGTILAMPPSLMLVGYDVAKPVLNVLGLFAGVYVLMIHGKHVSWKEFRKIVAVMTVGIIAGIFLKSLFAGKEIILYKLLGIFVIWLSIKGYYRLVKQEAKEAVQRSGTGLNVKSVLLLVGSGIVHGMFVSGGPLLIGYLSGVIKEKTSFRATISTVWIVLNTIIMIDDIRNGLWNPQLIKVQIISIPFLIGGMVIGTKLYKTMSQQVFMKLTYILLFISGISLLIK